MWNSRSFITCRIESPPVTKTSRFGSLVNAFKWPAITLKTAYMNNPNAETRNKISFSSLCSSVLNLSDCTLQFMLEEDVRCILFVSHEWVVIVMRERQTKHYRKRNEQNYIQNDCVFVKNVNGNAYDPHTYLIKPIIIAIILSTMRTQCDTSAR